jgi:hypothetical protein
MKFKFKKNLNYNYIYIGLFVVSIFIIIITINYKNTTENYINYNSNKFLTKKETQQFISDDDDNYIKNLSIYDLRARKTSSSDEYLNLIIENCMDFNKEQKDKLDYCSKKAKTFFNNGYDWIFALVDHIYEEGFPHTRGQVIFLSPNILNYNNEELTKTLIHESIHIYQRFNTDKINEYIKNNGYTIFKKKEKNSLIRANPDLNEYIYKDKNGVEMVAYYKSEYPNGINDTLLTNSSNEHPFEKMAYEIAEEYYKSIMEKYKNI